MKRQKLTKEQKDYLKPFVEAEHVAGAAFLKASEMIRDSNKKLWAKIKEINPKATRIEYPAKSNWYLIIDDS
jgi:hypothetical protein